VSVFCSHGPLFVNLSGWSETQLKFKTTLPWRCCLGLLFALLSFHAARSIGASFRLYPYVRQHCDEVQTAREALLYLYTGRGHSLNWSYGGGFPTVLGTSLRSTSLGRLPTDSGLALAWQNPSYFFIWGRLISTVWSFVPLCAVYLGCRRILTAPISLALTTLILADSSFAQRSSLCEPDMQCAAFASLSLFATDYYLRARSEHQLACSLIFGAFAAGAAMSTKYSSWYLSVTWLWAMVQMRNRSNLPIDILRTITVGLIAFLLLSPQWVRFPAASFGGVLFELRHQQHGSLSYGQYTYSLLWPFVQSAQNGDFSVWLFTAASSWAIFRSSAGASVSVGFVAALIMVMRSSVHASHYLLPSLAAGAFASRYVFIQADLRVQRIFKGALLLCFMSAILRFALNVQEQALADTRLMTYEFLRAKIPAGCRAFFMVFDDQETGCPLQILPIWRYRNADQKLNAPSTTDSPLWTPAQIKELDPNVLIVFTDWTQTWDRNAIMPDDSLSLMAKEVGMSAFWPVPPGFNERFRARPGPGISGPALSVFIRDDIQLLP